jgi:Synergist-CTERM protein sorting domain-containing protein
VGDYDGVFAQYLLYEDDVVSHDNWFSYVAEAHANLKDFSLSPGFAQYLAVQPGVDGCQWASTTNFKSSAITTSFGGQAARAHMVYGVRGEDKMKPANVENFCEYTEIGYRHWWERPVCDKICKEDVFFDDDECWIYTPMNVDLATWVEVFDFVNVASDDVDYFQDCDYTCGGVLGWYHDDQARNIKDYLKVEDPDAHVCLETEFGLQVTELSCNPDTGIIPIKVEFLLREEDQVCCNDAKTAIRNKLDLLGAKRVCSEPGTVSYRGDGDTEDRPIGDFANLAPVDAFLSEGGGDLLQLIFMGRNGVPYDLVKIANDYFEGDSANYPWLGAKNFFRVWPQTLVSGDVTDDDYDREMLSVKEAWLGGEQLEFSFYAVFVGADPAPGGDYVVARSGYFVIYTGAPDPQNDETRMIDGKVAVVCNWDGGVSPTPPPAKTPEIVSITSDPQGSVTDVACVSDDELTKDSFSDAAWTSILTALSISDEDDYLYDVTCKDCDDYVVSLDAGLSLDVKVTYEEGEPAPAAGTYRSVFVKDVANSLYDVLAAEELAIAVEKDVQGVIFEGGDYDADASDDTLKAGFCLLQVVATPKTDTPTTTPSGDGGSSGCSFGFAPLALLLLAPLALLRK